MKCKMAPVQTDGASFFLVSSRAACHCEASSRRQKDVRQGVFRLSYVVLSAEAWSIVTPPPSPRCRRDQLGALTLPWDGDRTAKLHRKHTAVTRFCQNPLETLLPYHRWPLRPPPPQTQLFAFLLQLPSKDFFFFFVIKKNEIERGTEVSP